MAINLTFLNFSLNFSIDSNLLLAISDKSLVLKISYVAKKINKNFRPEEAISFSLDYLGKWAALT